MVLLYCCLWYRRGIYPRYSQCDWDASYAANLGLSHSERHLAERVRAESTRIVTKSEYQARARQCSSTKKLGACTPPAPPCARF